MSRLCLWWVWLDAFARMFVQGSDYYFITRCDVRASAHVATVIYRVLRASRGQRR